MVQCEKEYSWNSEKKNSIRRTENQPNIAVSLILFLNTIPYFCLVRIFYDLVHYLRQLKVAIVLKKKREPFKEPTRKLNYSTSSSCTIFYSFRAKPLCKSQKPKLKSWILVLTPKSADFYEKYIILMNSNHWIFLIVLRSGNVFKGSDATMRFFCA